MRNNFRIARIVVTGLLIVAITLFCASCTEGCRTNNIRNIKTETDSVYSFVTSDGITIGSKYYKFEDLACSTARYKKPETGYPHWYDYREDRTLFLYELKNVKKGADTTAADKYQNNHMFDLGLFSVDNRTGDCTMLGLYKDVYPTYKFRGTYENIVFGVDNDYLVLFYNGRVEVLDINSCETVYSRQFFAEDAFKNHEGVLPNSAGCLPYDFTDGNDLVIYENNGAIKLYRYFNGAYAETPIEIEYKGRFEYSNNIGNIIYIYYYENGSYDKENFLHRFEKTTVKYELIYDIENGCEVNEEALLSLLRVEKEKMDIAAEPRLFVGDDTYVYDDGDFDKAFTVTRERDGKSIELNIDYFQERSAAYVQLVNSWKPGDTVYAYAIGAYAVDNKLLICCRGSTPAIYLSMKTPRYYFELDFESGDVLYAGFSKHGYYNAEKIVRH